MCVDAPADESQEMCSLKAFMEDLKGLEQGEGRSQWGIVSRLYGLTDSSSDTVLRLLCCE